jgi:competence protein ComEC
MRARPGDPPTEPLRFRQIPLAAAAVWLALGILLAHFVWQPTVVLLAALALLGALALAALWLRSGIAWVPVAALWLTLGIAAAEWQPAPPLPTALLALADNLSRDVRATVVRVHPAALTQDTRDADAAPAWEAAELSEPDDQPAYTVDLALDQAEEVTPDLSRMLPVNGEVRVSVYGAAMPLSCGDQVALPLRMKIPERYRNPGQFQYADWLLARGIAAHASIDADRIVRTGHAAATLHCRLAAAQSWAAGRLAGFTQSAANTRLPQALRLTEADAAMLDSMLFGDRTGLTRPLRTAFERTGSFHLFVVSGLHLALFAAGVFWLLRRMRAPEWLATLLTLTVTAAYAALTGFGAPAQRALAMLAVFLVARLLSRGRNSLNALGAAAVAMLLWSPSSLFEAGFQMTLLAILAIAGLAVPLGRATFLRHATVAGEAFRQPRSHLPARQAALRLRLELWGETLQRLLGRWPLRLPWHARKRAPFAILTPRKLPAVTFKAALWAGELALVGLVTELVLVLPMAVWFHRAAVFALPANLLVIPVLALLIPAAVATFAASLVGPWLAVLPGAITALLLHAIAAVVGHLSRLAAADVRIPGPVWWIGLAAVIVWLGGCWLVRQGRRGALATAFVLPLVAAAVLWPEPTQFTPGALEITAIDVGQGDSLLAIGPTGETMLIDAGGPVGRHGMAEIVSTFDTGEQVVAPYLWTRRLRRLDIVVLTHAHTDHMGGMPAILEDFHPRELWVSVEPNSPLFRALLAEASRRGITVRHLHAGDKPGWGGGVAVSVLGPRPGYVNHGAPKNDDSLVLEMEYGRASVLLEGDAERPSEDSMLAAGQIHPVTLLKAGHHGSKTSSNPEFLAAAAPADAVISVGLGNTFGHPRREVIERFAEAHTRLFRTDKFGLTQFLLTPDGQIRVQTGAGTAFAQ